MLNPHLDLSVSITCASEFARTGGFEINIWQVFFSTDVYYHTFDNCDSTSLPAHPYLTSIEQCRLAPPPPPAGVIHNILRQWQLKCNRNSNANRYSTIV